MDQIMNELLAKLDAGEPTNDLLIIDRNTRKITIPKTEEVFGVVCDAYSEAKYFGIERTPTSEIDLAASMIFATWAIQLEDGSVESGTPIGVTEKVYNDKNLVCKWVLPPMLFEHSGRILFNLHFHGTNGTKWHTTDAYGKILNGQILNDDDISEEDQERLKSFVDLLIENLRDEYDVPGLKQEVSQLKEDLNQIKEQGSGLTKDLKDAFIAYFTHAIPDFDDANGLEYRSNLLRALGESDVSDPDVPVDPPVDPTPDEPDEPTAPTLTGITVTWSAESADVGTDPRTLISSVKANYSDGSSQTVTGYTVTPSSLVEGNNTVTVTYNGNTATKTILGNTASVTPKYSLEECQDVTVLNRYNDASKPKLVSILGNRVSLSSEIADANWSLDVNLSSLPSKGQSSAITDTWFTIPNGASYVFKARNIEKQNASGNFEIGLRTTTGNKDVKLLIPLGSNSDAYVSGQASTDINVSNVCTSFMSGANMTYAFDITLEVNGERWI